MHDLKQNELREINGGSLSFTAYLGIGIAAAFLIGVLDGIVNPQKCND